MWSVLSLTWLKFQFVLPANEVQIQNSADLLQSVWCGSYCLKTRLGLQNTKVWCSLHCQQYKAWAAVYSILPQILLGLQSRIYCPKYPLGCSLWSIIYCPNITWAAVYNILPQILLGLWAIKYNILPQISLGLQSIKYNILLQISLGMQSIKSIIYCPKYHLGCGLC